MKLEIFGDILGLGLIILLVGILTIGLIPVHSNNIEKVKYCKIDSIYSASTQEFISKTITKYHTKCNIIFTSTHQYNINDSIEVKTIIIE